MQLAAGIWEGQLVNEGHAQLSQGVELYTPETAVQLAETNYKLGIQEYKKANCVLTEKAKKIFNDTIVYYFSAATNPEGKPLLSLEHHIHWLECIGIICKHRTSKQKTTHQKEFKEYTQHIETCLQKVQVPAILSQLKDNDYRHLFHLKKIILIALIEKNYEGFNAYFNETISTLNELKSPTPEDLQQIADLKVILGKFIAQDIEARFRLISSNDRPRPVSPDDVQHCETAVLTLEFIFSDIKQQKTGEKSQKQELCKKIINYYLQLADYFFNLKNQEKANQFAKVIIRLIQENNLSDINFGQQAIRRLKTLAPDVQFKKEEKAEIKNSPIQRTEQIILVENTTVDIQGFKNDFESFKQSLKGDHSEFKELISECERVIELATSLTQLKKDILDANKPNFLRKPKQLSSFLTRHQIFVTSKNAAIENLAKAKSQFEKMQRDALELKKQELELKKQELRNEIKNYNVAELNQQSAGLNNEIQQIHDALKTISPEHLSTNTQLRRKLEAQCSTSIKTATQEIKYDLTDIESWDLTKLQDTANTVGAACQEQLALVVRLTQQKEKLTLLCGKIHNHFHDEFQAAIKNIKANRTQISEQFNQLKQSTLVLFPLIKRLGDGKRELIDPSVDNTLVGLTKEVTNTATLFNDTVNPANQALDAFMSKHLSSTPQKLSDWNTIRIEFAELCKSQKITDEQLASQIAHLEKIKKSLESFIRDIPELLKKLEQDKGPNKPETSNPEQKNQLASANEGSTVFSIKLPEQLTTIRTQRSRTVDKYTKITESISQLFTEIKQLGNGKKNLLESLSQELLQHRSNFHTLCKQFCDAKDVANHALDDFATTSLKETSKDINAESLLQQQFSMFCQNQHSIDIKLIGWLNELGTINDKLHKIHQDMPAIVKVAQQNLARKVITRQHPVWTNSTNAVESASNNLEAGPVVNAGQFPQTPRI